MKRLFILAVIVVVLSLIVGLVALAAPGERVTICHLANNNQYIQITVADDATFGGHIAHEGDIIPAPAEGCPGHH